MSALSLPVTQEEITAQWLTAALRERFPGVAVTELVRVDIMQGTATKTRLRVVYDAAGQRAGLPATLIIKGGFAAHREMMASIYELEARFYRDIAPRLELTLPRCYFSGSDPVRHQAIVLLEDLAARGARFCRVQQPLTFEETAAQLRAQAALHAKWWASAELAPGGSLDWVEPLDPLPEGDAGTYQRGQLMAEVYTHYMSLPRGVAVSRIFHDRDLMESMLERLRGFDREGPRCLLHGDAHLGNLYFDQDGAAGMLDWQSPRQGPWSHDVAYFLGSALDVVDRRAWERPLLELYLVELRRRGVTPPTFEEAWHAYGVQMLYGLYYWLVNPVEFQAELNNCAVAPRFALAALDHGTRERLCAL